MHAVITPRISSSPYISHLQNINFYLVYIIITNHSETRNINPVDWSSHFPLYILFLSWKGSGLTLFGIWNTFSLPSFSQMSAITYIMSNLALTLHCGRRWFSSRYQLYEHLFSRSRASTSPPTRRHKMVSSDSRQGSLFWLYKPDKVLLEAAPL